MKTGQRRFLTSKNVLAVILGGGAGTRLFPLTKDRAKPAVPLGGKYRLVDIPISNCLNSGFNQIYLLTQFNSASLHRHISQAYKMDHFGGGYVEILAAEQTPSDTSWYQGTADAVKKNLTHLLNHSFDYLIILSGDQLYHMDLRELVYRHIETDAEITVATLPVPRKDVHGFGVMKLAEDERITDFIEKPKERGLQDRYKLPIEWYSRLGIEGNEESWLASMGIYVFNRETLTEMLVGDQHDFGKHIIPDAIKERRVFGYIFQGAWEDIGTIKAFFEANLDLASENPRFNFFDYSAPTFTRPRFLPSTKINGANIKTSILSEGCIINGATIENSVIGLRTSIDENSTVRRAVVMGNDFFESRESIEKNKTAGCPRIGIGRNTRIENAIIDKNVRIGDDCVITPEGKAENVDHPLYFIRDGIVIVPKNGCIPSGTKI
ncbi:MAG TPA: glucose-1-phosphate adenylyltransferase [Verrucomicrobiae bacterium]